MSGATMGWRMGPSLPAAARVVRATDEGPDLRTLVLDRVLDAQPGQFVMAWLPGVDEKPLSLVDAAPVTLTVARVGPFTAAAHRLAPGDRLWLRGPLGRGFALPAGGAAGGLLLIAGGCGVAPLHFLARRATAAGWPVTVLIGARTAAGVALADRFAALGATVRPVTEDGSLGERGLVTEAAGRLLAGRAAAFRTVYACGPEPMLAAAAALARASGLPVQLSYERYMRCGFGVCGSCSRDGWLVCADGPVRRGP